MIGSVQVKKQISISIKPNQSKKTFYFKFCLMYLKLI